jgi:CheY-like chemotaxis protein/nitrogen-specific signal transduction histidine kinase
MERTDFEQWKGKEVARLLALVETERRYYQEIVATLPVAIAVLAGNRSIVLANRAFRQTFGLTAQEIRRKSIEQILPSDELIERIRSAYTEAGEAPRGALTLHISGKVLRIDVRTIRGWDEEMELETLVVVEELSSHDLASIANAEASIDPFGAVASASSIPEAPPASAVEPGAELGVEPGVEHLVEHAVETPAAPAEAPPAPAPATFPAADVPAIVWQADAATLQFTAVSGFTTIALAVPPVEWPQTEGFFEQRIYAEDRAAAMALYRSVIEHGGEASAEFRILKLSGDLEWCRETVFAPPPAAGSADGPRNIYGVLTFIGERIRMQQQMEVAARHAALTGVGARLAHDLNNPLMLIAGYAEEMLHAFPEGDARRDDVEQIVKATERISEIMAHLTRFTQKKQTHPEPVDVSAAVNRLDPIFMGMCGDASSVRLEAATPVWALAEARPLEELLVTLADAARDCPGCTQLRIASDSTTIAEQIPNATLAPGIYARVTLEANGRGLDSSKSVSLFESILAKSADSPRGESLANAYTLAREWGGDLAYSGGTAHSTFILYLRPAAAPESATAHTPEMDTNPPVVFVEPEPAPPPEPPKPFILVVDDEPGIRALVAKILRREHYEVLEAGTAAEAGALADAQARPLQLLVTDIVLPDHPGTRLAEQLSAALPALKVLYMSGYTEDERARAGEIPPGAKFLQKPFTLSALVAKVRESLSEIPGSEA